MTISHLLSDHSHWLNDSGSSILSWWCHIVAEWRCSEFTLCCCVNFPHFFGWRLDLPPITWAGNITPVSAQLWGKTFSFQHVSEVLHVCLTIFPAVSSQKKGGLSPFCGPRPSERCGAASVGFAVVALTIWALNSGVQSSHEAWHRGVPTRRSTNGEILAIFYWCALWKN